MGTGTASGMDRGAALCAFQHCGAGGGAPLSIVRVFVTVVSHGLSDADYITTKQGAAAQCSWLTSARAQITRHVGGQQHR